MGIQGRWAQRQVGGADSAGFPASAPLALDPLGPGQLLWVHCSIPGLPTLAAGSACPSRQHLHNQTRLQALPMSPGPGPVEGGLSRPRRTLSALLGAWERLSRLLSFSQCRGPWRGPLVRAGGERRGLRGRETCRCQPGGEWTRGMQTSSPGGWGGAQQPKGMTARSLQPLCWERGREASGGGGGTEPAGQWVGELVGLEFVAGHHQGVC